MRGALVLLLAAVVAAVPVKDERIARLDSGLVKGHYVNDDKVIEWLGIPFASPPVGSLRFSSPVSEKPWGEDIYHADQVAPGCPQNCTVMKTACPEVTSEDCLYLNVWAPAGLLNQRGARRKGSIVSSKETVNHALQSTYKDSFVDINLVQTESASASELQSTIATAPVYAFIHGGMYLLGHSGSSFLNATRMAESGLVVVSFNYRLGALGFLSLGEFSGNFGFQDQMFALEWIQRNIHAFGGDSNRVTLGGQSAGASSVSLHLTSPATVGLFHQAILESAPLGLPLLTQEQAAFELGHDFATALGCDPDVPDTVASCLRNASVSQIVDAQAMAQNQIKSVRKLYGSPYFSALALPWSPVIGGHIPDQPLTLIQQGQWHKMPVIAGFTKDEFASFVPFFIPELGTYSYDALIYAYFGLRASGRILDEYPAMDNITDQRLVLAEVIRDMFIACPLRSITRNNTLPGFLYRFDHILADSRLWQEYQEYCSNSACHSSEVALVFSGKDAPSRTSAEGSLTEDEKIASESIHRYWTSFVKRGDPNHDDEFPWPKSVGPGPYLVMDTPFSLAPHGVVSHHCDLWDDIGYFW